MISVGKCSLTNIPGLIWRIQIFSLVKKNVSDKSKSNDYQTLSQESPSLSIRILINSGRANDG